jgi:hypothetical protein
LVGRQALELEFKGGSEKRTPAEKRDYIRDHRPRGLSVAEGCRLMGIARSTYYDVPAARTGDAELLSGSEMTGNGVATSDPPNERICFRCLTPFDATFRTHL